MSDPTEFVSTTIDELLLSMAEGLVQAQEELGRLRTVDDLGRPGPSYQIPHLEFELRVSARLTEDAALDHRYALEATRRATRKKHLLVQPVQPTAGTGLFQAEIVSTLRGRFVAVPPNGGLPPLTVASEIVRLGPASRRLAVTVTNALGEAIAGLEVHFNLDLAASQALSAADGVALPALRPGTRLVGGLVRTDAAGRASNELTLDAGEPTGASVVVSVDVAGVSESLTIIVGS